MSGSILIAGIGNVFQGDDAFGVNVVERLSNLPLPANVRLMDVGIRSIDLAFALLDDHDLTILIDATSRGGTPGTVYTIEIRPQDISDVCDEGSLINSHGLDPVRVLSLAKSMGALLTNVVLIGCEPEVLDCDATGHIGLSKSAAYAVERAVGTICEIVADYQVQNQNTRKEVLHESG
jgi:hydrogenase maturation protease